MRSLIKSLIILVAVTYYYKEDLGRSKRSYLQAVELLHLIHNRNLNNTNQTRSQLQKVVQRDYLKLTHPDTVLEDLYIYRTQAFGDSIRNHVRKHYFDSQPLQEAFQSRALKSHQDKQMSQWTTLLMVSYMRWRHYIFSNYGLLEKTTKSPWPESLFNKVVMAEYVQLYVDRLKRNNATEECLNEAYYFKKIWRLDDVAQCEDFFRRANAQYLDPNVQGEVYKYVKKNNKHDQQGTELVFKAVYQQVAEIYDYGRNCSQPPQTLMMQEYIDNPLLLENRKFDIRLHIVVTSYYPLTIYLYRKFYLMKCAYEFSHNEFKNQSHICSAGYQRRLFKILKEQGKHDELKRTLPEDQITEMVTYEQFADKLIKEGKIKDRSWIDTHMIPELEKRFAHYFKSYLEQDGEINTPRVGEYTACEIAFDDTLKPWFLECTTNPNMIPGSTGAMGPFQYGLHSDAIPMLADYARQKYRKIKNLVENNLLKMVAGKSAREVVERHGETLQQLVEDTLKEQVIRNPKYEKAFQLVNLERAFSTCQPYL